MFIFNTNAVKRAVTKIGGPTKASNLLGCSNGSIHSWIRKGFVPDIDQARRLAELAGMEVEEVRPVV